MLNLLMFGEKTWRDEIWFCDLVYYYVIINVMEATWEHVIGVVIVSGLQINEARQIIT